MPSSSSDTDVPTAISALARRYRRFDRLLSIALAGVVVLASIVVVAALSLLPSVLVLVVLLSLLGVPVFSVSGTITLVTDEDADAVRRDFESTTPPVLAFQWASADEIRTTPNGTEYDFSSLFGLRSITMVTEADSDADRNVIELASQSGGREWGTYTVSIADDGESTRVDIELESDRRFELARLTQLVAASRYQDEILAEQGYTVRDRDRSVSISVNRG
ncbi:hypothetical protein [Natronococcus occultus]|uniref:Uncharacterized protein n=1 Tax=Natronococcus occultus SP4 TaxID=694430 RepID=L0K4T7_9EURY|nr:hypothetical protein [Natronococcus occultus]AGB39364.1 hypothetical protein Natoc_3648 [Natronococcus occultus SP4]